VHPHQIPTVDVAAVSHDTVVLDVREDEEWDAGHIAGARHVPMFELPQRVAYSDELTRDQPIVVVCKMGGRSAQVTAWLTQQGFDAANLDGGMLAWAAAGKPMVSEDGQAPRVA
jgi:rhodanese-related sulfurtransferase